MIIVEIYGKNDCSACQGTKNKFSAFIKKWKLKDKLKIKYFDLDSEKGMCEGANWNVSKIPTTIIMKKGVMVERWDGKVPLSKEFKKILKKEEKE